jgi:hypothetical protein
MPGSRRLAVAFALLLSACGSAQRYETVVELPSSARAKEPLALDTVEIGTADWQKIAHHTRSVPCDRDAHHVARDRLALVNEAFRASGHAELDAECDPDSVSFTAGGSAHDVDHVRAVVESDSDGRYVRFVALSLRTGFFAVGMVHTDSHPSGDGIVISSIQRYLPGQLGNVYFSQNGMRDEIYVTGKGDDHNGIYLVMPMHLGEKYSVGIARFVVKD